jgi:hypothetical protein
MGSGVYPKPPPQAADRRAGALAAAGWRSDRSARDAAEIDHAVVDLEHERAVLDRQAAAAVVADDRDSGEIARSRDLESARLGTRAIPGPAPEALSGSGTAIDDDTIASGAARGLGDAGVATGSAYPFEAAITAGSGGRAWSRSGQAGLRPRSRSLSPSPERPRTATEEAVRPHTPHRECVRRNRPRARCRSYRACEPLDRGEIDRQIDR